MPWYVYVAQCGDGSLYTGVTTDLQKRLREHNAGRGSVYVRSRKGVSLKYTERCANRSAAQQRESQIKSWTREEKLALMSSSEPFDAGSRLRVL
jgi:putative endonuclease